MTQKNISQVYETLYGCEEYQNLPPIFMLIVLKYDELNKSEQMTEDRKELIQTLSKASELCDKSYASRYSNPNIYVRATAVKEGITNEVRDYALKLVDFYDGSHRNKPKISILDIQTKERNNVLTVISPHHIPTKLLPKFKGLGWLIRFMNYQDNKVNN